MRQPLWEFEVERSMFDVDVFKFKAIASNIKEKGPCMTAKSFLRQPLLSG